MGGKRLASDPKEVCPTLLGWQLQGFGGGAWPLSARIRRGTTRLMNSSQPGSPTSHGDFNGSKHIALHCEKLFTAIVCNKSLTTCECIVIRRWGNEKKITRKACEKGQQKSCSASFSRSNKYGRLPSLTEDIPTSSQLKSLPIDLHDVGPIMNNCPTKIGVLFSVFNLGG